LRRSGGATPLLDLDIESFGLVKAAALRPVERRVVAPATQFSATVIFVSAAAGAASAAMATAASTTLRMKPSSLVTMWLPVR
jgi:hypothetical protein